ncbi:MAG TPA: hypothetical protein VKG89_03420 [Solirubrobacterales bacterium]|nr:hypothetical protein [Solirubrobacterales bacterium]
MIRRKPRRGGEEPVELAPDPREPLRFKVVDVLTRRTLAEDVDARAAMEYLESVRSVADVRVYVWEPGVERWRALTLGEQTTLRSLGARGSGATGAALSG